MRGFFLVLLLLMALASGAQAQSCNSFTTTQCYANANACHWDISTGVCVTGVAASCEEHYTDPATCQSDSRGCYVNPYSKLCQTSEPACTTLTQSQCASRIECNYDNGASCQWGPSSVGASCSYRAVNSTCPSTGCFYDDWAYMPTSTGRVMGYCFDTIQQPLARFTCSAWNYYPSSNKAGGVNYACLAHGCRQQGQLCITDTQTNIQDPSVAYSYSTALSYTVTPPVVLAANQSFTAQFLIPLSNYFNAGSPVHYSVSIGPPISADQFNTRLQGTDSCVSSGFYAYRDVQWNVVSGVPAAQLTNFFTDRIAITQGLNFETRLVSPSNTAAYNDEGTQLDQTANVIGRNRVVTDRTTGILTAVSVANGNVALTISGDMKRWVRDCGCSASVGASYTRFTIPYQVTAASQSSIGATSLAAAQGSFTVDIYTTGTVDVQTTSAYVRSLDSVVIDTFDGCASAAYKRRVLNVSVHYGNSFDPTTVVGITDLSKVRVPPASNCFGLYPVQVKPPTSCPGNMCTTTVTLSTRCELIRSDCEQLNLCNTVPVAEQNADLAAWNAVSPGMYTTWSVVSSLNSILSFNYDLATWPVGNLAAAVVSNNIQPAASSYVNQKACGLDAGVAASFVVKGGFLPKPTSLLTALLAPVAGVASYTGTGQSYLGSVQLYFNRVVTFVAFFEDDVARQTTLLSLTPSLITITPLNAAGVELTALGSFTYTTGGTNSIQKSAAYSVRSDLATCASCRLLPVVTAAPGVDGFAVDALFLRAIIAANGYRIRATYTAVLPTTPQAPGRRLLEAADNAVNGTLVVDVFPSMNDTSVDYTRQDLGESSSSIGATIGFVSVVVGGAALFAGGMWLVGGTRATLFVPKSVPSL